VLVVSAMEGKTGHQESSGDSEVSVARSMCRLCWYYY